MPVWLRRFTFNKIKEYYDKQKEEYEKQQSSLNTKTTGKTIKPPDFITNKPTKK